jgi:hypothetical protein
MQKLFSLFSFVFSRLHHLMRYSKLSDGEYVRKRGDREDNLNPYYNITSTTQKITNFSKQKKWYDYYSISETLDYLCDPEY